MAPSEQSVSQEAREFEAHIADYIALEEGSSESLALFALENADRILAALRTTQADNVLRSLLREALPHVEAMEMEGDLDIRDLLLRIDAALKAPTTEPNPDLRLEWRKGPPPKPWSEEWFIAQTTYGDRVVLTSLPEEYTYDFKTADDTYIKAEKIAKWMQFPDSQYIAPEPNPEGMKVAERVKEAAAKVADEHRSRIPGHNPDVQRDDLVAQGYGNAALNIACSIRALDLSTLPASPVDEGLELDCSVRALSAYGQHQIARARREMGPARWAALNAEWAEQPTDRKDAP